MRTNDAFSAYHPWVNFLYFLAVLLYTMFFMHPVCLVISFVTGLIYLYYLKGSTGFKKQLVFILPMFFIMALLNPVFSHEGSTILAYMPNGNPLTKESILYGIASGCMFASIIAWFGCLNEVLSTDKYTYLFGSVIPALSLVFSMTLRFVPKFTNQLKKIRDAQASAGGDDNPTKLRGKLKQGLSIFSILLGWSMENAIETADSMKGRGYGLPGRTAFSVYRFERRDLLCLLTLVLAAGTVLLGSVKGWIYWQYYPVMRGELTGPGAFAVYALYAVLCLLPLGIDLYEDIQWKSIGSKT